MAEFLKTESCESICENIQFGIENKSFNLSNEQKTTKNHHEQSTGLRIQELLQAWQRHTQIFSADDLKCCKIASELCSLMVKTKSFEPLAIFLQNIPDRREYRSDENIIRAKVYLALQKKDTKTVYQLLEENHFDNGEDLIKVWDEALYIDEERRTKKALTPLSRFRARKRCPPPKTICAGGIRKTNTLPREATNHLKAWLMAHVSDPYPSATENAQLAKISGLTQAQVKTWFANARRRNKNTEDFQKRCRPSTDSGTLNTSPISPAASLSIPHNADTHSPYFMFNNDSLPSFEGSSGGAGTCCDYYHLSGGYNHRHVCSNDLFAEQHPYSIGANNPRAWRGSEQFYYDSLAGRNFMDFSASRSHHHLDYPLQHGYF